jgi:hypothetical protein
MAKSNHSIADALMGSAVSNFNGRRVRRLKAHAQSPSCAAQIAPAMSHMNDVTHDRSERSPDVAVCPGMPAAWWCRCVPA